MNLSKGILNIEYDLLGYPKKVNVPNSSDLLMTCVVS